jgi:hypothetical protein
MPVFPKNAIVGSIAALAALATLASSVNASAQTAHKPAHHKVHAPAPRNASELPIAPGVDLGTSTYSNLGAENHYYSDTVASGRSDLMDQTYRYGQSPATRYNSEDSPLFRF